MKKVLSLILALAMMLSMVTFAHADEPAAEATDITITYWNANTTTVVLELSRKVESAQVLKDAMTLSGFTADDFTVKEQTSPAGQYEGNIVNTNTTTKNGVTTTKKYSFRKLTPNNTTYTVQLVEGKSFAFGTAYTLTVAESLFGSTTVLTFTVNKIAVDTLATQGPWHASTASKLTFDEGVLALDKNRAKLNHQSTEVFGDTRFPITQWENNATNNPARDRINMEVDVKVANTSVDHHVSIGFANRSNTWAIQSNSYSGFAGLGFGGNSAGVGTFSVFVAKTGEDPNAEYGDIDTTLPSGEYYAAQSHGNVFGNMAYNGPDRAWPVTGTTSPFATDAYKHMAYFYDAASATEDGRVTLGVEDKFYNYVHDMPVTNLRANPHFVTSGSKAYFKDLIISYPEGEIEIVEVEAYDLLPPINFEINTKRISFTLNKNIPEAVLKSGLSLTADGEAVAEFTLTQTSATDEVYTYSVSFDGDFDPQSKYVLTLAAGSYTDAYGSTGTLASDYVSAELAPPVSTFERPLYWNADTTRVVFDLPANIPAAQLADAVNFYVGPDKAENYTFEQLTNLSDSKASGIYTYAITPAGGLEGGDKNIYTLSIDEGTYVDTEHNLHKLTQNYLVSFKLDKIVIEDFDYADAKAEMEKVEYTFNTSGDKAKKLNLPWNIGSYVDYPYAILDALKDNEGNGYMTVQTYGRAWIGTDGGNVYEAVKDEETGDVLEQKLVGKTLPFANTGNQAYTLYRQKKNNNLDEYARYWYLQGHNTEFKVKVDSPNDKYKFEVRQAEEPYTAHGTDYNQLIISKSGSTIKVQGALCDEGTSVVSTGSVTVASADIESSSYISLAMCAKGGDAKYFVNGAFLHANSGTPEMTRYGSTMLNLDQGIEGGGNTYYFDQMIISKVIEVDDALVFGKPVVKYNGEKITSFENVTGPVDVAVSVLRLDAKSAAALPVQAVLAVYNTLTNEMTNYGLCDVKAILNGVTELEFKDIALNDGNSITVFLWDSFYNLIPYTLPCDFPEAN